MANSKMENPKLRCLNLGTEKYRGFLNIGNENCDNIGYN